MKLRFRNPVQLSPVAAKHLSAAYFEYFLE